MNLLRRANTANRKMRFRSGIPRKNRTHDYTYHSGTHSCLLLHHHRRPIAKRKKRRYFGRLWRTGQPDGVWAPGGSQRPFEGDHMVSRGVHGDLHHAVDLCLAARWPELGAAGDEVAAREDAART